MRGGVPHLGGLPGQQCRVTCLGGVSFLHVNAVDLTGILVFNNAIHKLCKIQFWKKLFAIGFLNKHCNLTALPTREVGVENCDKAYSISHREVCGGDSIRPIYPVMGIGGNTIRPLRGNFYQVLAEMKLSLQD